MPQLRQTFRHGLFFFVFLFTFLMLWLILQFDLAFLAVARSLIDLSAPPSPPQQQQTESSTTTTTLTTSIVAPVHDLKFPTYHVQLIIDRSKAKFYLILLLCF